MPLYHPPVLPFPSIPCRSLLKAQTYPPSLSLLHSKLPLSQCPFPNNLLFPLSPAALARSAPPSFLATLFVTNTAAVTPPLTPFLPNTPVINPLPPTTPTTPLHFSTAIALETFQTSLHNAPSQNLSTFIRAFSESFETRPWLLTINAQPFCTNVANAVVTTAPFSKQRPPTRMIPINILPPRYQVAIHPCPSRPHSPSARTKSLVLFALKSFTEKISSANFRAMSTTFSIPSASSTGSFRITDALCAMIPSPTFLWALQPPTLQTPRVLMLIPLAAFPCRRWIMLQACSSFNQSPPVGGVSTFTANALCLIHIRLVRSMFRRKSLREGKPLRPAVGRVRERRGKRRHIEKRSKSWHRGRRRERKRGVQGLIHTLSMIMFAWS